MYCWLKLPQQPQLSYLSGHTSTFVVCVDICSDDVHKLEVPDHPQKRCAMQTLTLSVGSSLS